MRQRRGPRHQRGHRDPPCQHRHAQFRERTGGGIANGFLEDSGGTVIITESAITDNASIIGGGWDLEQWRNGNHQHDDRRERIALSIALRGWYRHREFRRDPAADEQHPDGEHQPFFGPIFVAEALSNDSGTVLLANTILARNTNASGTDSPDCSGTITSLANNLIGDPTGCTITLQPSDLTGDPGFGPFTDNGRPGNGHFPLLSTSQAKDAGNDALCPRTDQLGRRRLGPCDIGAIEFRERDEPLPDDEEEDEHDAEDEEDEEDVG